ncbi:acyltransferase [Sphingomonas sp. AP4-R1]|uniref:acyltransferase family protein n=1 Tax=Sphingomonas sp. AP4-R1 TaxID=2735134 RepID=UPI0020A4B2EE|nr:acyltransferase [Sphingomonas sp. AP4-R1]
MRLILALLVVWSHSFAIWYGTERDEPLSLLLNGVYNAGNIAVLGFFTISGFLITLSWQRSSTAGSYLAKRIARIIPGYFVATLVSSLVVVPILSGLPFGRITGQDALGLLSNLWLRNFIVPAPGYEGAVNGSLWSIPYEFWCYLGIMGLGLAGLLRFRILLPVAAILVMLTRTILDLLGKHPGGGLIEQVIGYPYLWFVVLPSFLIGAAMLLYREHLPRSGVAAAGLVLLTIASAWVPLPGGWAGAQTRLLLPPTLAYALFHVAFHPRWQLGDAARYGDFSYGAYLYAFPIQQMLKVGLLAAGIRFFPFYVVTAMLASLAAGVASWFLVERWFEQRKRKRKPKPLEEETLLAAP